MIVDEGRLLGVFLIFLRVGGVLLAMPALSSVNLPARVKVGLAVVLTALLAGARPATAATPGAGELLPAATGELLVGLLIGLGFRWSMAAASTAGELIGLQMGLGVGSVMDPLSGNNATIVEQLYALTFLALFFALGGAHLTLWTLSESFSLVAVGSARFSDEWFLGVLSQTGAAIILGVRLAAGVVVPLLVLMFAMALMARAFPQANMFTLSFTVSLLAGLALLALSADSLRDAADAALKAAVPDVGRVLKAGAG